MLACRLLIAALPFAAPVAMADIGQRAQAVDRPIAGLTLTTTLSGARETGAPEPTKKTTRADFSPEFAVRSGPLATLRKRKMMPLVRMVESRDKHLYLGIARDGTVGIHYSFRRKP